VKEEAPSLARVVTRLEILETQEAARVRSGMFWSGALLLALIAAFAFAAPLFGSPIRQDFTNGLTKDGLPLGIGGRYLLGTDFLGRNMLARLAFGARASITVAVVSNATSLTIGTLVGVWAGYFRGRVETVLMRCTDIALAVPYVLAALVIAALLQAGIGRVIIIITALSWAYPARLIYGEVVRLRGRGFVEAAEAFGSPGRSTVLRHIVPHTIPLVVSYSPLNAAGAVLFEATLSYLGAGINPPTPSWGNMISDGQAALGIAPHILIEPSIALSLAVLSFLLLGEGFKRRSTNAVSRTSWLGV
jgi:peptide/nickel transport system permease protein